MVVERGGVGGVRCEWMVRGWSEWDGQRWE